MGNPPGPSPWSEDDEEYETPLPDAWMEELRWAELGQYKPLLASLRAGKALPENEEWATREFLADFLAGKVKPPKGKKPDYANSTWAMIAPGEWTMVKKNYKDVCDAAAFVWQCEREGKTRKEALSATFKEYRIRTEKRQTQLADFVKRSIKERKRLAEPATAKPKRT